MKNNFLNRGKGGITETFLNTRCFSDRVNRWNKNFNPVLDSIIRQSLANQQSPSKLLARHYSVSSEKVNPVLNKPKENKFKQFVKGFKQKFLTKLNSKLMSGLSYKAKHCTIDFETYNENGVAVPYVMGIYGFNGVFKAFYGKNAKLEVLDICLNLNLTIKKVKK